MTSYRLLLEKTYLAGNEIMSGSSELEAKSLGEKLDSLSAKWKSLIALLNELKEK